jgi:hypothetical protein
MRARLTNCLFLGVAALLAGCATLFRPQTPLFAIAPASLGERTVEQRLSMRWPGEHRSVDAVLEITSERLRLVMFTFGMRLSSLEYDGRTVHETRHAPRLPPAERMVHDLLLIGTPLAELRSALPKNWSVTDYGERHPRRREIKQDGDVLVVIRYFSDSPWQGRVEFEHRALGYQLILDSHEL